MQKQFLCVIVCYIQKQLYAKGGLFMEQDKLLLIHSKILPPIFAKVVDAKRLLETGKAKNTSEAVKRCNISRSAFYKYKDYVFPYNASNGSTLSFEAQLTDEAGVLSAMLKELYECGANVLTVNQSVPVNGRASVSVTVASDNLRTDCEGLIRKLSVARGVLAIKVL